MKFTRYIIVPFLAGLLMLSACESDETFLEETPSSFLTPENAYLNKSQFEMLIAAMHRNVQQFYNAGDGDKDAWARGIGTDVMFWPMDDQRVFNDWSLVNSLNGYSEDWYSWQYAIIKVANSVITYAQNEEVKWNGEEEKNAIIAEGRFFRAFAYRNLTNVFGGVPIVDKPLTEPKLDFTRASRTACWEFAKTDLEFAKDHLPLTTNMPGRVVRAAADHLLAEVCISLEDWTGAIDAATRVIDGTNGDYHLMTDRFGTRADEAGKNIYWDLYRMGNQNYDMGNKEAIWVAQMEYNTPGGTVNFGRPTIERMMWNRHWLFQRAGYSGVAQDSTGRGVSFVRPTNYANYSIWKNAGNDLRNTEAVIKRNYYFADDVDGYNKGDLIPKSFLTANEDTMQYIYPNWQKFGTDKHLDGKPDNGYVRDFYVMRLPETYLLRAEAYLGNSQPDKAADDINEIRNRAQAPLISAGDVTIDFILDERARELFGEEFRMLTLGRLGLTYERTKKYGYEPARNSISERNNLFPIPQTAIDRNVGAVLEQNPGYE
ncbi:MAG: RagB/SusD family nutrient uptake outer membrane protein [Marinilabiliaceae bacterium]|nr:RagB/SusD family nutrient uptake outer membrane protein [Marinilabiliaceae bacterium]